MSKRLKIEKGLHVEKKYMEWEITDFQRLINTSDKTLHTSKFSFMNKKWSVEISTRHYGHSWISLFLCAEDRDSFDSITFTLGMKYRGKEIEQNPLAYFHQEVYERGFREFYSIKKFLELCENASYISLTVYCYLHHHNTKQFVADTESQTSLFNAAALSRDFEDLLATGNHSDVTIKVHNNEFKVHKSILAARSPVFAAMFGHDMSEQTDGVVSIDDCDPDAFYYFLQCLYSGDIKYVSTDNLINLYTVADKYSVTDLMKTCVEMMTGELSVDNACEFLDLADQHNDAELKKCAQEFLIKNMKKALPTNNWTSFMSKHSSMAQDILLKSFPGTPNISLDFEDLISTGQQSDVTFKVNGQEFKAHKSVLVARSSVFADMFGEDMSKQNDGIVSIDDCDPDAFHHFLQCMYTGNLKYVSTNNLINLYAVAAKYSAADLKETCVQFMTKELSVDNACDFLVFADKHNEVKLKNDIEQFLIKNMKRALPTNNWKSFMSKHTSMAQAILIKSFSGTHEENVHVLPQFATEELSVNNACGSIIFSNPCF